MKIFLVPTIILLLASVAFGETTSTSITVPEGHVLGISPSCLSLHDARNKALRDAAAQVLRTIGAHYTLNFESKTSGTADSTEIIINERFHYSAQAFIQDLQRNTIKSSYEKTAAGYVYQTLIHYPPKKIERMRKLSLGPQLSARILTKTQEKLVIKITESRGVQATIDTANITTTADLRLAEFINYYVAKAQNHISTKTRIHINPLTINRSAGTVTLTLSHNSNLMYSQNISIELIGTDETGKQVSLATSF